MLTDPLTLPISPLWEYVILMVLGTIALQIGRYISPGGALGSIVHWVVRTLAFVMLWLITYWTIVATQWILMNGRLLLYPLLGLTIVVIGTITIVRFKMRK